MKKALLTLLMIVPFALMAQTTGSVSGKVIDRENDEPLGFVTVAIYPDGALSLHRAEAPMTTVHSL